MASFDPPTARRFALRQLELMESNGLGKRQAYKVVSQGQAQCRRMHRSMRSAAVCWDRGGAELVGSEGQAAGVLRWMGRWSNGSGGWSTELMVIRGGDAMDMERTGGGCALARAACQPVVITPH